MLNIICNVLYGVYLKFKAKDNSQGKEILLFARIWMSLEKPEHKKTDHKITHVCEP